jgi:hypothetical protein
MPPTIECRPLPLFAPEDLARVREAFINATPIALGQAWLAAPEKDFSPGLVRTGWREGSLLVFAELTDADVFTKAQRHNDRFWELGDTFEMFLQPPGSPAYVELHVTPNNLRLQLRFEKPPSVQDIDPFVAALIHDQIFDSRTWAMPEGKGWCVFADVPAAAVGYGPGDLAPSTWRFSFSRYDATRGREHPVISSSSPHTVPAFHRPHEWGELRAMAAEPDTIPPGETPPP